MDNKRKYFYLNNKEIGGPVFQSQILDWLYLFQEMDFDFELLQIFHIKDVLRHKYVKRQLSHVSKFKVKFSGYLFFFPSISFFRILNVLMLLYKFALYIKKYEKIVIFSRALIGREISILKIIFPSKIVFIFDARAASADENRYTGIKERDYTLKRFKTISNIYYLEYVTLQTAERVFSVSNVLSEYFVNTFDVSREKFVYYPCLSDYQKFNYDEQERITVRKVCGIPLDSMVFIYAGGITAPWHLSQKMINFFEGLLNVNTSAYFLFLSSDESGFHDLIKVYNHLKARLIFKKVPNDEVYRYLSAADFGLLFRENTIMNNVSSPTKYAEYLLCGLPVIITEGVGDYSSFTKENKVGVIVSQEELVNPNLFNYQLLNTMEFDRFLIATKGKKYFDKRSIVDKIIDEFVKI